MARNSSREGSRAGRRGSPRTSLRTRGLAQLTVEGPVAGAHTQKTTTRLPATKSKVTPLKTLVATTLKRQVKKKSGRVKWQVRGEVKEPDSGRGPMGR